MTDRSVTDRSVIRPASGAGFGRAGRAPLGPGVYDALARARDSLTTAARATTPSERYAAAHVAALRMTAAVLAGRAQPAPRRGSRSAWTLLSRVAPELTEWSAFFAAGAAKRAAAEAELPGAVSGREADDLLRNAERFLGVVEEALEVPQAA